MINLNNNNYNNNRQNTYRGNEEKKTMKRLPCLTCKVNKHHVH